MIEYKLRALWKLNCVQEHGERLSFIEFQVGVTSIDLWYLRIKIFDVEDRKQIPGIHGYIYL